MILTNFISDHKLSVKNFVNMVRRYSLRMRAIQKAYRTMLVCRAARMEALGRWWDRTEGRLRQEAFQLRTATGAERRALLLRRKAARGFEHVDPELVIPEDLKKNLVAIHFEKLRAEHRAELEAAASAYLYSSDDVRRAIACNTALSGLATKVCAITAASEEGHAKSIKHLMIFFRCYTRTSEEEMTANVVAGFVAAQQSKQEKKRIRQMRKQQLNKKSSVEFIGGASNRHQGSDEIREALQHADMLLNGPKKTDKPWAYNKMAKKHHYAPIIADHTPSK